jgi:branched-chain amino acid transport system ATP-binding protein
MLLGRNGAGKTTTLRTDHGPLSSPSAGHDRTLRWTTISPKLATPDVASLDIAYVPENHGQCSADLTVKREFVPRGARRGPLDATRLDWIFGFMPALKTLLAVSAPVLLSGGQKQMLSIARAMVEPRKLLLVDEPSKGLAPGHHPVNLIEWRSPR